MRVSVAGIALAGAFCTAFADLPANAQNRIGCVSAEAPSAHVVAVDGMVEVVNRAGEAMLLRLGEVVCPGDKITTGAASRLELRFEGANTTTGASSNTTIVIPVPGPDASDVRLDSGLLRFISSVHGFFRISTPFQDAGIDGTEAVLAVDGPAEDSLILVREGLVTATDRRDPELQFTLAEGEASFAGRLTGMIRATPDNVPQKFRSLLLNPEGASDWAVYYPPLLLTAGVKAPEVIRAAELLDAGDPDGADALLSDISLVPRDAAAALALRSVIAVFRNELADGAAFASAALEQAPDLGAAHIAQSYSLQAAGQLHAARAAAERAVAAAPEDAYAWARLAELHLTLGERRAARAAVQQSLTLAETSLARTIEGFAELSTGRQTEAQAAFSRAIAIDNEAPLPHLGLGLSAIRKGNLEEGRREIETAVALDPRRASLRTWLGRAYLEEGRGDKAGAQFDLALQEDPDDANAALFSALQLFSENRPIEALSAVEAAQDRTPGRAVIRSPQGLGEDRAVQGAALGRLYDVLGLEQRAIAEGSQAVDADPSNPGAHRFLADIFRTQENAEIVQTSELLKADLLGPPSGIPLQPQLVESDLALLDTSGPTRVTFSEFAPLFDANGVQVDLSGLIGSIGNEAAVTILHDGISLRLGQFYYETNGFRRNNDVDHLVLDAQAKVSVTPWLDLFAEYRFRETEGGDREIDFDIGDFDPSLRQEFERELWRLGFHAEPGPRTDFFGVFTVGEAETREEFTGFFGGADLATASDEAIDLQLSGIHRFDNLILTVGGTYTEVDAETLNLINFPGFPPFIPPSVITVETDRNIDQYGLYAYANFTLPEPVDWVVGASYNVYDDPEGIGKRTEFNPKIGARLRITEDVAIRAAYARSVKPRLVTEQLLEPTTVMGFSQYLDILNGSVLETVGGAIDADVTDTFRIGAEVTAHWWDNPVSGGGGTTDSKDLIVQAYVHKTFLDRWALSVGARHEKAKSDFLPDLEEFELTSVPVTLRYFDPIGVFGLASVEPAFHSFRSNLGERGDDAFIMLNAAIGYRLPDGRGVLSLEAQNLLDQRVRFQDRSLRRDILQVPRFAPELTIVAKATLRF
jgi:tetratricopeptide (TPR) repeat protein